MHRRERYVVGVEIGGRQRRVALADLDGRVLCQRTQPSPLQAPAPAVEEIRNLVARCLEHAGLASSEVVRAGCGFSGPIEGDGGIVMRSHRFPDWDGVPLASLLEEALGTVTVVDNNARVAGLGEARFGAGRGEPHLLYMHLDAGLGGGLVIHGRPYRGASTTAGEIGHMLVAEDGPKCSCGKPGHLEAFASASAIVGRTLGLQHQSPQDGPLATYLRAGTPITPRLVFEAAEAGDEVAGVIVREAIHFLGIALANLVTVLNPGAVVIGGSVADAGDLLFEPLRARVRRYTTTASGRAARIIPAALQGDSILLGSVALALTNYADEITGMTLI